MSPKRVGSSTRIRAPRLTPGIPIHISGLVGRAYLSRGAWLWIAMRAVAGVLLVSFSANPIRVPVAVSAALVVAVFVVSYADVQRRQERNFLHNLGMPVMLIVAISAIPAVIAESAIELAQTLSR